MPPAVTCSPHTGLRVGSLALGGLAILGPIATDMYAAVLPAVARDLHASTSSTQLTLTAYLIALGVGQVIAGPLSDTFGRRRPLLVGCALYCAAGVACALANSVLVLCCARLAQGAAAAAGVAISRAIVRDLYRGIEAARAFSRLFLVVAMSPVLGPVAATQVLHLGSWRGVFVAISALGIVLWIVVGLRVPETLPPGRRTTRGVGRALRTMEQLFRQRQFTGYAIPLGCGTGALVTMVGGAPFVVEDGYHRSTQLYAALFVVCALGMAAMTRANGLLLRWLRPERLLVAGMALTVASGVALLGVGGHALWAFGLCFGLVFSTWGLTAANATALALRGHAGVAGTAAALAGFVQYAMGAAVAPVAGLLGNGSPVSLGVVVSSVGAVGLASAWSTSARGSQPGLTENDPPPGASAADVGLV